MACGIRRRLGAEAELEDEDFLSAVEDAENRFLAPAAPSLAPAAPSLSPAAPSLAPGAPAAPSLAPGAPSLAPAAPSLSPAAPSLAPGAPAAPSLAPAAPSLAPAAPSLSPAAPSLAPAAPSLAPAAPSLAPAAPSLAPAAPSVQRRPCPALRPLAGGSRSPPGPPLQLEGPGCGERPPREPGSLKRPREGAGPGPPQAVPRLGLRPRAAGGCPPAPPIPMGRPRSCSPAPRAPSPRPFQAVGAGNPPVEPPPALQSPVVTNHLVQLVTAANKAPGAAPRPPAHGKARRFPGPAGILPQQHAGKLLEEILISALQTPCHGAMAKPRAEGVLSSSLPTEEDFGKGPWLAMKTELELDERDPSCFLRTYSVVMVLRKAALKQLPRNKVPSMAVMIKTLTRTNVDAAAVFRDPTGEMQGTVHRLLLEERQSELRPGSVLLLRQVGVFSPSHRNHYLNVTPNNLLKVYPAEPEGSFSQPSPAEQEVPAQAPAHPMEPPWGVPAPGHCGGHSRPHSTEQAPGQEEPAGAGGCDVDDLDGLLGELPEDFFSSPAQGDRC